MVLEAAQTSHLSETLHIATTDDSAKYTWFKNPVARVQAIYTPAGFLKEGETATPEHDVVRGEWLMVSMSVSAVRVSMSSRDGGVDRVLLATCVDL